MERLTHGTISMRSLYNEFGKRYTGINMVVSALVAADRLVMYGDGPLQHRLLMRKDKLVRGARSWF